MQPVYWHHLQRGHKNGLKTPAELIIFGCLIYRMYINILDWINRTEQNERKWRKRKSWIACIWLCVCACVCVLVVNLYLWAMHELWWTPAAPVFQQKRLQRAAYRRTVRSVEMTTRPFKFHVKNIVILMFIMNTELLNWASQYLICKLKNKLVVLIIRPYWPW